MHAIATAATAIAFTLPSPGTQQGTLETLWGVAEDLAMPALAPAAALGAEIRLIQSEAEAAPTTRPLDTAFDTTPHQTGAQLAQWLAAVCALHSVRVSDLGSSLSDGRALCTLLAHYQPSLLDRARPSSIKAFTTAVQSHPAPCSDCVVLHGPLSLHGPLGLN